MTIRCYRECKPLDLYHYRETPINITTTDPQKKVEQGASSSQRDEREDRTWCCRTEVQRILVRDQAVSRSCVLFG